MDEKASIKLSRSKLNFVAIIVLPIWAKTTTKLINLELRRLFCEIRSNFWSNNEIKMYLIFLFGGTESIFVLYSAIKVRKKNSEYFSKSDKSSPFFIKIRHISKLIFCIKTHLLALFSKTLLIQSDTRSLCLEKSKALV